MQTILDPTGKAHLVLAEDPAGFVRDILTMQMRWYRLLLNTLEHKAGLPLSD